MTLRWAGRILVTGLAVLLLAAGCGKKTKPVPPGSVAPSPITNLQYELDEKGVTLSWPVPDETVTGKGLPYQVKGFEVFRAVMAEEAYCEGCPVPFGRPRFVEHDPQADGRGLVRYTEAVLRPGHRYVYKVRSKAGWYLESDDSNLVSFAWDTPPQAPGHVQIEPGDRTLHISWQPPTMLLDGKALHDPLVYQVLRSEDGSNFSLIHESGTTAIDDSGLVNGQRYLYKVRAIRLYRNTRAAGMATDAVAATPQDMTPPAPPKGVVVVRNEHGIRILWQEGAAKDLAGYRVYRRILGEGETQLVGEVRAGIHSFLDTERVIDTAYYSVTAIDLSEPPNESLPSLEAEYTPTR